MNHAELVVRIVALEIQLDRLNHFSRRLMWMVGTLMALEILHVMLELR